MGFLNPISPGQRPRGTEEHGKSTIATKLPTTSHDPLAGKSNLVRLFTIRESGYKGMAGRGPVPPVLRKNVHEKYAIWLKGIFGIGLLRRV